MTATDHYSRIIQKVAKLSDDILAWQSRFLKATFFLEDRTDRTSLILPLGHQDVRELLQASGVFDQGFIDGLDQSKNELENAASTLINNVFKAQGRPESLEYNQFSVCFESYIKILHWLERDLQDARRGVDPETGFKVSSVLYTDIAREQDRRARRGKPFSIILARIDRYKTLKERGDTQVHRAIFALATKSLRVSLRSFDDVYRLNEDEFLVVLKQTDLPGGFRFSERIREMMLTSNLRFDMDGLMYVASMSFYVAEPLPDENIKEYIEQIRSDMERGTAQVSSIAQFQEVPLIERMAKGT